MFEEQDTQEFIVTARKWRPLRFKDVVGQEHITVTLKNAVIHNRVHHAYLFSGPRGVGKTTTARILARALNCLEPVDSEPCNKCISCQSILDGRSLDVIEIDGASNNSVDDVRKLRENAKYAPSSGKYKMYIIDEVHMLSTSAFNALLKTLEEPPPHLLFVFATTEPHKVPATILSRCQRYGFRSMEIPSIVNQLKFIAERESIRIDDESLITIAKKADGSMRDSQSIFDQAVAFCGKSIVYSDLAEALHLIDQDFYFNISRALKDKNLPELFNITRDIVIKGYDLQECLGGLLEHFRNVLSVKVTGSTKLIDSSADFLSKYEKTAKEFSRADILRMMQIISITDQSLRFSPQPRIKFEVALVQMAMLDTAVEISGLLEEIKSLKNMNFSASSSDTVSPGTKDTPRQPFPEKKTVKEAITDKFAHPADKFATGIAIQEVINISAEHIKKRWSEFINRYGDHSTGLYMLSQQDMYESEFLNGEVILKVFNRFAFENINIKKSIIVQCLKEFFGGIISIKIIHDEASPMIQDKKKSEIEAEFQILEKKEEELSGNSSINDIKNKETDVGSSDSPVEQKIIELFNPKILDN